MTRHTVISHGLSAIILCNSTSAKVSDAISGFFACFYRAMLRRARLWLGVSSFAMPMWSRYLNVTDGETDRQTDRRTYDIM